MRQAFAHEAILVLPPDADLRAPGAAITAALCGHWEHEPPCPLAAHHTRADRIGDQVRIRTLFATEPADEPTVRQRIDRALRAGWRLDTSRASELTADEAAHAERLARS